MHQPRLASLGFLAGLLAVCAFSPIAGAQAAPAAASTGTRIAVVNLQDVYRKMQETVDSNTQISGMKGQLDTLQQSDKLQLTALQDKINNSTKAGTPEREKATDDLDQKNLEFQIGEQKLKIQMVRMQGRQLKAAFDEIQKVVTDLAKQKGYDLVLVNNSADVPEAAGDLDPEQLARLIFSRSTLYVSDKVDITAQVITQLDYNFKHPAVAPAK